MKTQSILTALLLLALHNTATSADPAYPDNPAHGQTHVQDTGTFLAWDAERELWLEPTTFWLSFARRRGGLSWGRSTEYPPYGEVAEHDTLLIELNSGVCLMEFFHQRWRRAQDVQRWSQAFNEYGACPHVFK